MERTFCPWQTGNQTPFLLELGQSFLAFGFGELHCVLTKPREIRSNLLLGAGCTRKCTFVYMLHLCTCSYLPRVYAHMYEGQRLTLVSSSVAPLIIFEAGYFSEPEPTNSARLAGQWPPGIFLSLSLRCWAYRYTLAFIQVLGSKFRSSYLPGKDSTNCSISPALSPVPLFLFFKEIFNLHLYVCV